ncbi:MAG: glycosyltransferase family 9 protein [Cyclobacteriaceae bacterium]
MGDVALSVPVIHRVLQQNQEVKITVLTRKSFQPLFQGLDVEFVFPDLYGKHKGVFGLFKLYKELRSLKNWHAIIDLHDVLRSKILRVFFQLSGTPIYKIDKGRTEKKNLTRQTDKRFSKLKHTTVRYADVFISAGLKTDLEKTVSIPTIPLPPEVESLIESNQKPIIGIAPFAKHKEKMYPSSKMADVVVALADKGYSVFIFGGGDQEKQLADDFSKDKTTVTNLIGKYNLSDELAILSQMDIVLSMDSANMHMAALVETKVISVWGATHPFAGFTPFGQSNEDQFIQIPAEELPCRPCSVFGNKPCHRGDFACMEWIEPDRIVSTIEQHIQT